MALKTEEVSGASYVNNEATVPMGVGETAIVCALPYPALVVHTTVEAVVQLVVKQLVSSTATIGVK